MFKFVPAPCHKDKMLFGGNFCLHLAQFEISSLLDQLEGIVLRRINALLDNCESILYETTSSVRCLKTFGPRILIGQGGPRQISHLFYQRA